MQKQWVESNIIFEKYVGRKHRQSASLSMLRGELVVIEIDQTLFPNFKTAEEKKTHLDALEF